MVVPNSINLKLDITQPITEVFMLQEISRKEKLFCMCQRNKLSLLKWHLLPRLEKKCMRKVSDRGLSHQSIHSYVHSLCKNAGSLNQNGSTISTFCQNPTLTSPFSSLLRKRNGSKAALSLIKSKRRLSTSSQTTT